MLSNIIRLKRFVNLDIQNNIDTVYKYYKIENSVIF